MIQKFYSLIYATVSRSLTFEKHEKTAASLINYFHALANHGNKQRTGSHYSRLSYSSYNDYFSNKNDDVTKVTM